jgi:cell shape-determining protein MreC
MNNDYGNTLLKHCGEPEMPTPAVRAILPDAVCVGELTRENEALRKQNAELEEHNQSLANERDRYRSQCHRLEDRLAGREYE